MMRKLAGMAILMAVTVSLGLNSAEARPKGSAMVDVAISTPQVAGTGTFRHPAICLLKGLLSNELKKTSLPYGK